MPEPPSPPSRLSSPPPPPPPAIPNQQFHFGDEFGTAKRNLPPAGIVAACILVVAVFVGIFAFVQRAKPQGSGSVDLVTAAEVPGQGLTLVAVTVTLRNTADKPLWIRTVSANLTTADGQSLDDKAASVVDLDRYFHAFPALQQGAEPPLAPESKLLPGASQKGTIIVAYKLSKEAVEQRKALTVSIRPYDQPLPIILR